MMGNKYTMHLHMTYMLYIYVLSFTGFKSQPRYTHLTPMKMIALGFTCTHNYAACDALGLLCHEDMSYKTKVE